MTQYVSVKIGKGTYTYKHNGAKVQVDDTVIVDATYSGARPVEVVGVSNTPPTRKKPAVDGYSGAVKASTLR